MCVVCHDNGSPSHVPYAVPENHKVVSSQKNFLSQARSRSLHETSKQLAGIATRRFLPLVLHDFDKASGNGDKIVYNCLPSCATIGWALMARDLGIVARIAEYTLARDKEFCVESPSEDPYPHPTEIAEMAAIVLGFCNDQALRSVPPSQSFQPATSLSELCLSSELAFLVRYAKLQQCFASGDIETAVDRLIDLLITGSGSSSAVELGAASCGSGSLISTRLRLRLLTEVRHLLGRRCIRRDQAELLISALVDLRLDTCEDPTEDNKKLNDLLVHIHILLAQELTSSLLVRESQINNVVLGGVTPNEHIAQQELLHRLHCVLERIQQYGFRLRAEKCAFFLTSIKYLGFIFDEHGRHPEPEHISAIQQMATPNVNAPNGKSPAEVLMNRKVRLPVDVIRPTPHSPTGRNINMEVQFNRHHGTAKNIFIPGKSVLAKDYRGGAEKWTQGIIVRRAGRVVYELRASYLPAAPTLDPVLPLETLPDIFELAQKPKSPEPINEPEIPKVVHPEDGPIGSESLSYECN
ncbi:hypothetical protein T265_05440 [Opisthorchis viverrini]|uniref:Uncharacterized protein n=1 Tax=Opisthorchis viverrini TaxID=6198 RepID=A0A074ZJM8_OPIVI|nr:hypothetical protein T265_05440 [Opisthorchis viverrini]KER27553.1 hypothetical protein T265_05440 [Opisthorchis viverrini]